MSLEDKFTPEDNGPFDVIDRRLISLGKRVGEYWQEKTATPKQKLTTLLCNVGSGMIFAEGIYYREPIYLITGLGLGVWMYKLKVEMTPQEEEIYLEAKGLPRKFFRYMRVIGALDIATLSIAGAMTLGEGIVNNDHTAYNNGLQTLLCRAGFSLGLLGFYISRSKLPPPESKRKEALAALSAPLIEQKQTY